jgi:DNA-binding beta-propeller fold protein YncE
MHEGRNTYFVIAIRQLTFLALAVALVMPFAQAQSSFIGPLHLGPMVSTVPANGDVNPYGMALVQESTGNLVKGDILISNFNNSANLQGTGTTIMEISPEGAVQTFAQINAAQLPGACPGGVGLTTALVELRAGWVIVGSLPTTDGTSATAKAGCLLVLNSKGQVVETFSGEKVNGPWDATVVERGDVAALFFTNVLNGTVAANGSVVHSATVVRMLLSDSATSMPKIMQTTVVGSDFPARTDPAALVIGPTGLALNGEGNRLYVNDSLSNRIAAISNPLTRSDSAGAGMTLTSGKELNDPLGLTRAPNGDLIAANGGNGNLVEVTPAGQQIATKTVDTGGGPPPGAGDLFGIVAVPDKVYFVDDGTNTLDVLER